MSFKILQNSTNRRSGPRVSQTRPVKIFHPAANRYIPAETVDLSSGGLRLVLPRGAAVVEGALLQVHVASQVGGSQLASKRSMMPARVVWVDRSGDGVRVGVQYVAAASGAAVSAA